MGWEQGRYYTRSRRVNGRVVRQYVGCDFLATLEADVDEMVRLQRREVLQERQRLEAKLDQLAATTLKMNKTCDLLTKALLHAYGYHQHKRGEWRKKRVPHTTNAAPDKHGFDDSANHG